MTRAVKILSILFRALKAPGTKPRGVFLLASKSRRRIGIEVQVERNARFPDDLRDCGTFRRALCQARST